MLKHNPVLSSVILVAALACSRIPLEIGEGIDGVFAPGNGGTLDERCLAELELCLESGRDGADCEQDQHRCETVQYPSTGGSAGVGGSPSGCMYVAAAGSAAYICPGAGGTTAGAGAAGATGGSSGDCVASGGRAGAGGAGGTGGNCGGSAGGAGGTSTGGTGSAGTSAGGAGAGGAGAGGAAAGGTSAGGTGSGGGAPLDCIAPYDACLDSGEEPAVCHELFTACNASAS